MASDENNLIWIDLEMTGLIPEKDRIIEIATIITDSNLTLLAEGPCIAVHQNDELLNNMNAWCTEQHFKSGLVSRVQQSTYTEAQAEQATLEFIQQYVPAGKSPMCGNSICQDRRFLYHYMPKLEAYFHYRHLDVSTIKILVQRWAPKLIDKVEKESAHLALQDIYDSINELRLYREHFLRY